MPTEQRDGIRNPPSLQHVVLSLVLLVLVVVVLYYGRGLLLPMCFGALLAVLVSPIKQKLVAAGMPRWLGLTAAVSVPIAILAVMLGIVGRQAAQFAEDWPQIKAHAVKQANYLEEELPSVIANFARGDTEQEEEAEEEPDGLRGQLSDLGQRLTSVVQRTEEKPAEESVRAPTAAEAEQSSAEAVQYGVEKLKGMAEVEGAQLSDAVGRVGSALVNTALVFVYLAFFLAQERRIYGFLMRRTAPEDHAEMRDLLEEISEMTRQYLAGRLVVVGVLAVLYGIGFSLSGLEYALFVALLASVLSVIPYLGNIIGGLITLVFVFANGGDGSVVLGVVVTGFVGQLIENYILTPFVVGERVKVNPMTTIVSVIAFTLMWGGVGAVLAIPFSAIVRIVCDHVPALRDYGYLLGEGDVEDAPLA